MALFLYPNVSILPTASAFTTIQPDAGTSPVATGASDTLTLTSSDGSVTITGTAGTDTIDLTGAGSPGGADTQLQYNNSSAFGGIANFTFDGTDLTVANGTNLIARGSGATSTEFGASADASAVNAVAIGESATSSASNSVALGRQSTAQGTQNNAAIGGNSVAGSASGTSQHNTAVGVQAVAGSATNGIQSTAVGKSANAAGSNNTIIGFAAGSNNPNQSCALGAQANPSASATGQIAIGRLATTTAGNQLVIGSSSDPITDAYIGEGVTSSTPQDVQLNASGGSGTDIAAGDFILAVGRSTGNADPGRMVMQTTLATTTGSTAQTLVDTLTLDNKNTIVGDGSLGTTDTDGFLYIPSTAGAPSGVPTSFSGRVALQYDTTNERLYVYNGAWVSVTLA